MSSGFNLNAGSSGFSFGAKTTAAATPVFSLGSKPATSSAAPSGFSFGSTAPAATGASSGFSFGQPSVTVTTASGSSFPFSQPTSNATTAPTSNFSFGQVASSSSSLPSLGSTAVTAATKNPAAFSLGGAVGATKPTTFSLGGASVQSTSAAPTSTFSFGSQVTSSSTSVNPLSTSGFNTKPATSVSLTTTQQLTQPSSLSTSNTGGLNFSNATVKSSAATISSTAPQLKEISYKELEETVDKWLHDLTEQEKVFLNQASQVNIWDKQLIENGEKIADVHNEVERVKAEQQRLDRELDYILSQQEELEDLLKPIEAQMKTQNVLQHSQPSDMERDRTFQLAENVDSQLKHMMQDLREIIDHVNNSNSKPTNTDDTMTHIAKILNAHMDSLQWVDQNTNQLQKRVDEVTHVLENRKREHEKSYHSTY